MIQNGVLYSGSGLATLRADKLEMERKSAILWVVTDDKDCAPKRLKGHGDILANAAEHVSLTTDDEYQNLVVCGESVGGNYALLICRDWDGYWIGRHYDFDVVEGVNKELCI